MGYSPWGRKKSDTTEQLNHHNYPPVKINKLNVKKKKERKSQTAVARGWVPLRDDWYTRCVASVFIHLFPVSRDAENLLESQPLGSFLIRVSHSHVGYTLSYK